MKGAEPIAFGPLLLKPEEFYRMTPGEFDRMVEGLRLKEEREMERLGWLIVNIANTCGHLKKPLTLDKVLGKKKAQKKDRRMELEYLNAKFGG